MDAFREFYGRHGVVLTLIIFAVICFVWSWILVKIAKAGGVRYDLRMIRSVSMGVLFIGFATFLVGLITHPTECSPPCDIGVLNREHFQIFGGVVGLTSLVALVLNIRKSSLLFGTIFTLAQASIAIFAVILLFVAMVVRDERRSQARRI